MPRSIIVPRKHGARVWVPRVPARQRVELAGALIDRVDFSAAVNRLRGFMRSGQSHQVVTVNLDFLAIAHRHPEFRETINQADLAVADGMPLVWASHLAGEPLAERLTGVELADACCALALEAGRSVFLLGGKAEVTAAAAGRLQARHPGLRIGGVYAPPFGPLTPAEDERIVRAIQAAAPGFLMVALGAPRQDLWIRTHRDRLGVPVSMGVGCVFDLLAGAVSRAPHWMQRSGLEWAFRLGQEPRRLWHRYLVDDVPVFAQLMLCTPKGGRPVSTHSPGVRLFGSDSDAPRLAVHSRFATPISTLTPAPYAAPISRFSLMSRSRAISTRAPEGRLQS